MTTALTNEVPFIYSVEDLKPYISNIYIIDDYMENDEKYNAFVNRIYNVIKATITIKNCREFPVTFKFYKDSKETYTVELRHFLIDIFLWEPFIELYGVKIMDASLILNPKRDIPKLTGFIDNIISTLAYLNVKKTVINHRISNVLYNLRSISLNFSMIMNLNFSAETFVDTYINNPRIREIMEVHFDTTMQPSVIEDTVHKLQVEEIELYKNIPNNPIGVIFSSGTGFKDKQFAEYTISQALKPDLVGKTIPVPISNSTLVGGLEKPSDRYIDANAARKSSVSNHNVMGHAGYFGKILLILSRTLVLSTTVSDCRTKHNVKYEVKSKAFLKRLNGKYYKMNKDDDEYMVINAKDCEHLIGKEIYIRSVATCALEDEVCAKCFGLSANFNWDIADGVSGFESEEISKVINQSILSTKHLLTTVSEVIKFSEGFNRFFKLEGDYITPIVNDSNEEDISKWAISIDPESITKLEEFDNDSYNSYIKDGMFKVFNQKTGEVVDISSESNKDLYLSDTTIKLLKKGKGIIKFSSLEDDDPIFNIDIFNNELTRPLYELMALVNKQNKDNPQTIDEMSQNLAELLIEAGIKTNIVAAEIILNRLIRMESDKYQRPNFGKEDIGKYNIFTVDQALKNNKSIFVGISYQHIKQQLLDIDAFTVRDGVSYLDSLFMRTISTEPIRRRYQKMKHR